MSIIQNLTLTMPPNEIPTWQGTLPSTLLNESVRAIQTSVPITQVAGGYEYVKLDLLIKTISTADEDTVSLTGIPESTNNLAKQINPTVIVGCADLFDTYVDEEGEEGTTYNQLVAETLDEVLQGLFNNTGWSVSSDVPGVMDYPVVTEANPVVVLNGSLVEQLTELLGIFTPTNLWEQSLTFFINIFTLDVLIVPPTGGDMSVHVLPIDSVRPTNLDVTVTSVDTPLQLMLQEQDTALFRADAHVVHGDYHVEEYDYETTSVIHEDDEEQTFVSAAVDGSRTMIGGLTLTDYSHVLIDQTETSILSYTFGLGSNLEVSEIAQKWTTNKSSDITVSSEYEYLLGPPYDSIHPAHSPQLTVNGCYTKSKAGTRQQIARDYGSIFINKDRYPSRLLTTDGIRVTKKVVTTVENTTSSTTDPLTGQVYPSNTENEGETVTVVTEMFAYDDDGNLVTDRKETVVTQSTGLVDVTESTKIITPISDDLYAETVYSLKTSYDLEGSVIDSSVTDVGINVVSGEQSGPSPVSAYASIENEDLLREELYHTYTAKVRSKLYDSGEMVNYSAPTSGTLYTSVENLILEEVKSYLSAYYNIDPTDKYEVSFQSNFLDVRGVLGGSIQFTTSSSSKKGTLYSIDGDLTQPVTYDSGFIQKMAEAPFRVVGLSMAWSGEEVPEVAVALCQLI